MERDSAQVFFPIDKGPVAHPFHSLISSSVIHTCVPREVGIPGDALFQPHGNAVYTRQAAICAKGRPPWVLGTTAGGLGCQSGGKLNIPHNLVCNVRVRRGGWN